MHTFMLILIACGSCLAHYRDYESRNLMEREEPINDNSGKIVECPVCPDYGWMSSNEVCPIVNGNKTYKKCRLGTYINTVCGNRIDCLRGLDEQCTEKRDFDMFGQKCAPGFHCNKILGTCQGMGSEIDTRVIYYLNPRTNRQRVTVSGLGVNDFIRSD